MMHIDLAVIAVGLAAAYTLLRALLHFTQDTREPLSVENWIPFLSPMIAMGSKGSKFHKHMRDKYRLPIYTLRLPGSRLYVVNDTSLIPVLQRQVRTLSISPIIVRIFSHFMGVSRSALDTMDRDPVEDHGFVHQITLETTKGLAPGPNLDDLNSKAIMMATTTGVYGPQNPFKNPAVRAAYYKLEGGFLTLVTGFLPSLLAKEALKARRVITEAFLKYYAENGLADGASVYARTRHHYPISKHDALDILDIISYFSDPVVLKDCREEVKKAIREREGGTYLDLTTIKSSCPLLVSTMKEAFRFHSIGMSARTVVEDHLLDGKYLLKKGSTVLIPSTVQHNSPAAWSQDVDEFRHDRFIRPTNKAKNNPVAFRAFGGGGNSVSWSAFCFYGDPRICKHHSLTVRYQTRDGFMEHGAV
ncbi:cytochrome P450 [Apiospora aurea]|uniref:Cytochrome P450 n=1 Tax=Apiospora aurea TaxID=335848 RepID=A0ABR1QLZ5_9PEZI